MSQVHRPAAPIETRREWPSGSDERVHAVRCAICGQDLKAGRGDGEQNLAEHLRGSPRCRRAIRAWLDARGEP